MDEKNNHSFWQRLWHEIDPIFTHGLVVIVVLVTVLIVGLAMLLVKPWFPSEESFFGWIEQAEAFFIKPLLCIYMLFTLSFITIRLVKVLKREWHR